MKVFLQPTFRTPDNADGGVRRVVDALRKHLPGFGVTLVASMEEADLVHTHITGAPDVPVGQPYLFSCHGLYWAEDKWEGIWHQKVNNGVVDAMRKADQVTAPSEWVAQVLRRGMWLRPTVLHHGVDFEDWQGGQSEGYVLWNKTRVDPSCDPGPVNELARMDPKLQIVTTFGEAVPNVTVTGALPFTQAQEIVRNAGVYLATARETFGIGTIEAMAAGIPIVGWAWGGQREIIKQGETGMLVTPGDYEALQEAVHWALANRARIGQAAKADVLERWTWEIVVKRYADLYQGMITKAVAPFRTSVIVPCYNLAKYLPDALASVIAQTDPDWECIIVDDASTDNTESVARGFVEKDSRFRYLRNSKNLHVSMTRNRAITESNGRYIVPLDADDMMAPNAIEVLANALDKDRGIHIAYGGLSIMAEDGALRNSPHEWPPQFDFRDQIQMRNQVPTMAMFRRSVYDRTGGYRKRISPVEDADLWTRAASIGLVPKKVTEETTMLYRLRGNSLSRTMPHKDWTGWYPWSRQKALLPFGAAVEPPRGQAWPVPSYEPVNVAVIIPVGPGHEDLLIDALDSVEAQTFRNWECIVINDTGRPLKWTPSWARVLETPSPKSGPATARNIGIVASTAPLFVPLDADDFLQPDALALMVEAWTEHKGVIYSQWYDDKGEKPEVYNPADYDPRLLITKGCLHAVTALYSKVDWLRAGHFDESLTHWEDWDFQLSLASIGVCSTKIDRPLFTYRKNTGFRRDENYASFDAGKAAILAKWARIWDGKEELMACSSCPAGRKANGIPPTSGMSNPGLMAGDPGGAMLLEFTGLSAGVRTYKGQKTNTLYRFGNEPNHRMKYVLAADAPGLLAMSNTFKLAESRPGTQPSPVLTVENPPSVKDETVQPLEPATKDGWPNNAHIFWGSIDKATYQEIRAVVPTMTLEDTDRMIGMEKDNGNRTNVLKLLEAHKASLMTEAAVV